MFLYVLPHIISLFCFKIILSLEFYSHYLSQFPLILTHLNLLYLPNLSKWLIENKFLFLWFLIASSIMFLYVLPYVILLFYLKILSLEFYFQYLSVSTDPDSSKSIKFVKPCLSKWFIENRFLSLWFVFLLSLPSRFFVLCLVSFHCSVSRSYS